MAKSGKQAPPEQTEEKSKSKKPLLIAIGVLVLIIAGGAGWYFTKGSHTAEDAKQQEKNALPDQPKFIALEPFTVNLQREQGDQFLQVGITLKIYDPKLEDQIKTNLPEIRSKLLLLLSSKHASELTPVAGKKKLADEIITETDAVLGIHRPVPPVALANLVAASGVAASSGVAAASTPEAAEPTADEVPPPVDAQKSKEGIVEVLFTSFIIQ